MSVRDTCQGRWEQIQVVQTRRYCCGYCDRTVASERGLSGFTEARGSVHADHEWVYICPNCNAGTFFDGANNQYPGPMPGSHVRNLPQQIEQLFNEARRSANDAPTASVLVCRKMLMNLAVTAGAKENLRFIEYVDYLVANNYVPPNGKAWVDYIRKRGNEATHEIALMTPQDATALVNFVEMLLRFIYEMPSLVPPDTP